VKYTDYQRFGSKVKITYEGKEVPNQDDKNQKKDNPPPPQR